MIERSAMEANGIFLEIHWSTISEGNGIHEQNSKTDDTFILFNRISKRAATSVSAKYQIPLWIYSENIGFRLVKERI